MSLETIRFTIDRSADETGFTTIDRPWSHTGVVGSGDMEILLRKSDDSPSVGVTVVTPVRGFDSVWQAVIERFVNENNLGWLTIEINDNNATPFVAALRLSQALQEALEGDAADA